MLTIYKPCGEEKRKRQRQRALGYLIAGLIIMASIFLSWTSKFWFVPIAVEAWWLWAVYSHDWDKEVHRHGD
jgi:hypothetical protein